MHKKLIILGSGPAGYTAAIYAARANLQPTIITGWSSGGQLATTTDVDNWPGEKNGIQGPVLMSNMEEQAKRFGTEMITDHIESVDLTTKPFKLVGSTEYTCDALIIATGATAKYLGIPGEEEYLGSGVSACATCDGWFYENQDVAVVGGGNTAVEEALYLSAITKSVTLLVRGDRIKAEKVLVDKLMSRENIKVEFKATTLEILGGEEGVGYLVYEQQGSRKELLVSGVFVAIGHTPNTSFLDGALKLVDGYIATGANGNALTETSIPGVFAAGDVADRLYKQAVTAAASGCMAAIDANKYLES